MIALLKKILIIIGALSLVAGGYLLLTPKSEEEGKHILGLVSRGDLDQAEDELNDQRNLFSDPEYYLYRAYILRVKGQLQASDDELKKAQKASLQGEAPDVLQEVFLNQAYNFYIEGKQEEMAEAIGQVEKISSRENEWVKFFKSLNERMGKGEARSLKGWQKPEKLVPLSDWMKQEIVDNFNDFWFFIQDVRNDIILQNYTLARRKLEEKSGKATETQLEDINALLGMIYIKDAASKPKLASGPYYKLAFTHFDKVPMNQKRFAGDRAEVLTLITKQINFLIAEKQYQDLPFFASVLRKWNALEETEQLQAILMVILKEQSSGEDKKKLKNIIETLDQLVTDTAKREVLDRMFIDLINQSLSKGNLEPADTFWEGAKLFSNDSDALSIELGNQTAQTALDLVPLDDDQLDQSLPYFEFWSLLTKNPEARLAFANQLLQLAPSIWASDQNPGKSLQLIRLASGMVTLKQAEDFQKRVEETISLINKQYEERILQAKKLYEDGKYAEAWKILEHALKMNNKNQEALLYAGLTAYQLADYPHASNYLQKVQKNDEEVKLPLVVSQAILGDKKQETKLLEGDLKGQLTQELILRITLGSLMYGQPDTSLIWLGKIEGDNSEALALRFIVPALNKNWEHALQNYGAIPNEYKALEGIQGLYIQTLIGLNKIKEAEAEMNVEGKVKNVKSDETFPPLFQAFIKAKLNIYSADYIAGLYYLSYKKDPKKALEFIGKIQNPSPQVLLKLGMIYDALNRDDEALKVLSKALSNAENQKEIIQEATYLMATIYSENSLFYDAVIKYEQYFELVRESLDERLDYAGALIQVRKFKEALEQYLKVEKSKALTIDDQIRVIECLIHLNQDADAKKRMGTLLLGDTKLSAIQKVKTARLALITKDQVYVNRILTDLQKQDSDIDSSINRLGLLIMVGDYVNAKKIIDTKNKAFQDNADALFLLAKYYTKQGDLEEARKYLVSSLHQNPKNRSLVQLQERLFADKISIDVRIEEILNQLKIYPENISYTVDLSRQYIDRGIEEHSNDPHRSVETLVDIRKAIALLEPLEKKYDVFPEIYFLLGQAYFVSDKNKETLEYLQKALKIDPSYSEANKYLALTLIELKRPNDAIAALQDALRYDPDDAEAWKLMGDAYLMKGDALSADTAIGYALKYEPNNPQYYLFLGKLKLTLENPEEALTNLEKALKLAPNDHETLIALYATLSNAHLLRTSPKSAELKNRRDEIFEILKASNPEEAEKLRKRFANQI